MVHVTSPEGWHEIHLIPESGASGVYHVYVETPEIDPETGNAVFQFVETRGLTD